jgi:hypothetical protein
MMEQPKSNRIELIILAIGWLVVSILVGLMVAFGELESSSTMKASAALFNALEAGFLLFLAGLPIYGVIYFFERRKLKNDN